MIKALKKLVIVSLIASAIMVTSGFQSLPILPITGFHENLSTNHQKVDPYENIFLDDYLETEQANQESRKLQELLNSVLDGQSDVIKGLYVKGGLALEVIQQPSGQPAYVSSTDDAITEFSMARKYGVIGMLAHNYLAGSFFYEIKIGDIVNIVYGDGEVNKYLVTDIQSYQALQPTSPHSQFLDMSTNEKLSATQLFYKVYTGNPHLTLQTCIQEGSVDSWGRLFIIAEPI